MKELYEQLGISSQVYDFCHEIEESLKERFEKFDKTAEYNQMKVLLAMQKNRVSEECFGSSSGYGYNDYGRDTLEKVYADTFHTEACLVRPQIAWNACPGHCSFWKPASRRRNAGTSRKAI